MFIQAAAGRFFAGRLDTDADLLAALDNFCMAHEIYQAHLQVIGMVKEARIGFFNPKRGAYDTTYLDREFEILACPGNVSTMEDRPMVHAHIMLGDERGQTVGGHLLSGTRVFNAEFFIQELNGGRLERRYDQHTRAAVWSAVR